MSYWPYVNFELKLVCLNDEFMFSVAAIQQDCWKNYSDFSTFPENLFYTEMRMSRMNHELEVW